MDEIAERAFQEHPMGSANLFESPQELAWLVASQNGDVTAFNRLVLKWEKAIYNLALRMLQDVDEAAETTQEVFLNAYKNIRTFRRQARFSTWLYRITSNQCISRLRRRPPGVHYSLDDHRPGNSVEHDLPIRESHENDMLREESRLQVIQALEKLAPDQRVVVELKFFQELTFEEIAAILEEPLSTVKTRLYSGLDLLKDYLSQEQQRKRL